MTSPLKFLKEKLEIVEKRIAQSDDYVERKLLKKMIDELSSEGELIPPAKELKIIRTSKDFHNKDSCNTPNKEIPHGKRMEYVYNIVEKLLKENGGELEISFIEEYLQSEGMNFVRLKETNPGDKRLASYIASYNTLHPEYETLELLPRPREGQKRVFRYMSIRYIGKERLSDAV